MRIQLLGVLTATMTCGWAAADILEVPGEYPTIQEAIVAAVDGDEVVVSPGTYFEQIDLLGKEIVLRSTGGAGVTTIDAQRAGRVVTCENGETPATVIQGFTITGGEAFEGAGMRCIGSGVTIRDSVFFENLATGVYPDAPMGGGLYIQGPAVVTIENTRFEGNVAEAEQPGEQYDEAGWGGGILATDCTLTLDSCVFDNNDGTTGGGAVMATVADVVVTGCTFSNNYAVDLSADFSSCCILRESGDGGALYIAGELTVSDSDFLDNESTIGGAVSCRGALASFADCTFVRNIGVAGHWWGRTGAGGAAAVSVARFDRCAFDSNDSGAGGAIYSLSGPTIVDCVFRANVAYGFDGTVGRIFGDGGAIYAGPMHVDRSVFVANSAGDYGFAIRANSQAEVLNSLFAENFLQWEDYDTHGSGQFFVGDNGHLNATNVTIVGAENGAGGVTVIDREGAGTATLNNAIIWDNGGPLFGFDPEIRYSIVQGGFPGDGNLDVDPMFVGADTDDYRLADGSPAIDAGDNTAVPDGVETDLDGNTRFVDDPETDDTGIGPAPIVDMGPYEFQVECAADFNGDGDIDSDDFFAFLDAFADGDDRADIDGDGNLDADDFFAYLDLFALGCP